MQTPEDPRLEHEVSPTEMDYLGLLQEECAEVIQIISKIRRFGIASYNPWDPGRPPKTNRDLLHEEVGDVLTIIKLLTEGELSLLGEMSLANRRAFKEAKLLAVYGHPNP